jgi:DNA (cytosine-5)-methyltransferase 1
MLKIVDLFCGTGAISHGIRNYNERFSVVGGIDIDKAACETAQANHPGGKFLQSSIEDLPPREFCDVIGVDRVDLIVGGPPCQGFSSLRPNRASNVNDPRNRLYKHFVKYVEYLEPVAFLMENVVGLITQGRGQHVAQIIREFSRLGYQVDWRVLNAANYGIPQRRERVFFVGVKTSRVKRPMLRFPQPTHCFEGRVIGTRLKDKYVANPACGAPAITVAAAISDLPPLQSGEEKDYYATKPKNLYQRERRNGAGSRLTLHHATHHSRKMLQVIRVAGSSKLALPSGLVSSGFSSCYSRMAAAEPATTITVKFTSPASSKCIHPTQHRAISAREAARLQGFDDSFFFCGSRTDIANQIGNAVPPLFGTAIAPMLLENLEAKSRAH